MRMALDARPEFLGLSAGLGIDAPFCIEPSLHDLFLDDWISFFQDGFGDHRSPHYVFVTYVDVMKIARDTMQSFIDFPRPNCVSIFRVKIIKKASGRDC